MFPFGYGGTPPAQWRTPRGCYTQAFQLNRRKPGSVVNPSIHRARHNAQRKRESRGKTTPSPELASRYPSFRSRLAHRSSLIDRPQPRPTWPASYPLVYPHLVSLCRGVDDRENHQEKPKRLELLCGDEGALRRNAFQGRSDIYYQYYYQY